MTISCFPYCSFSLSFFSFAGNTPVYSALELVGWFGERSARAWLMTFFFFFVLLLAAVIIN